MTTHERRRGAVGGDHEQMAAEGDVGPLQGAPVTLITGCVMGHSRIAQIHRILLQEEEEEEEGTPALGNSFRSRLRPGT